MFEVFKKYVIKNDRKLLPVLDDMKLFKIKYIDNDEDKDIKRENIDTDEKCDTFQLPHNVTGIEIKDIFALVVDKYKNQKGVNKDRYVYILAKIDINSIPLLVNSPAYNGILSNSLYWDIFKIFDPYPAPSSTKQLAFDI